MITGLFYLPFGYLSSHATAAYGNKSGGEGRSTAKQQRQTQ